MYARKPHASGLFENSSDFFDSPAFFLSLCRKRRGDIAQLARAPALQAGCQGFKSPYLHKVFY